MSNLFLKNMKILITGGAGFTCLLRRLADLAGKSAQFFIHN